MVRYTGRGECGFARQQDGLKGRVETAYGMTEPHDMPGVACGQGHECTLKHYEGYNEAHYERSTHNEFRGARNTH